jgi:hypothetical protein
LEIDFNQIVVIVAFILSVFNLWDKIDARIKAKNEPTEVLKNRIQNLEALTSTEYVKRFADYDKHFDDDLKRIRSIEEGNRITQRALLALLKHSIDGNEVDELKSASDELTKYLINK